MNPVALTALIKECLSEVINEAGRQVCAWCKKDMGPIVGDLPPEVRHMDSHGICPECAAKLNKNEPTDEPQVP